MVNHMFYINYNDADPFNVWNDIQQNMESILPLPVHPKKINGTNWKKHGILHPEFRLDFVENRTFNCKYVKMYDSAGVENHHDGAINAENPYLHLYVIPPMDSEVFKKHVKGQLKSLISALKVKRIVIIYGICKKGDKAEQKANTKTISKIRHMLTYVSMSQNSLCLVPMLNLPLLTSTGLMKDEVEVEEDEEINAVKNWENVKLVMSEFISEAVGMRLSEISAVMHRKSSLSLYDGILFYDSILRIYSKFGSLSNAAEAYTTLINNIKPGLKNGLSTTDLTVPPFIFCVTSGCHLGAETNMFDLYQYLCCSVTGLWHRQNSVSSLSRACNMLLDCCMLTFTVARGSMTVKAFMWVLVFIKASVDYVEERMKCASDTSDFFEQTNDSVGCVQKSTRRSPFSKLRSTFRGHKVEKVHDIVTGSDLNKSPSLGSDSDKIGATTRSPELPPSSISIGCIDHSNSTKSIRRQLGLLYVFLYKTLKHLDNLLLDGEVFETTTSEAAVQCSEEYRQKESQLWEQLKLSDSRHDMLSEAAKNGALNFSHGDLHRFSYVMSILNDDESALSSIEKDCNFMGWSLGDLRNDAKDLYAWIDVDTPNLDLKDPLKCVQAALHPNLHVLNSSPNIRLTPNPIEDDAVNDYLRALAEAKMDIGNHPELIEIYGQFVKFTTLKCKFRLNVYAFEDVLDAKIRIRLREEGITGNASGSSAHNLEEISLDDVTLHHGVNVFDLKHTFKKLCNYTVESFLINGNGFQVVQKPGSPIPLGILSGVVRALKRQNIKSSHILSCLLLPTRFSYCVDKDVVHLTAHTCSDVALCSEPVILRGVCNYLLFHLTGFDSGRICFCKSEINYDIRRFSLFSEGLDTTMFEVTATEDGTVLNIANSNIYSHVMCVPVTVDVDSTQMKVYQDVVIYGKAKHVIRLEFTIIPPFCREVTTTKEGLPEVVLQPLAPYHTLIENAAVDGRFIVNEPTMLEPSSPFHISLGASCPPVEPDGSASFYRTGSNAISAFIARKDTSTKLEISTSSRASHEAMVNHPDNEEGSALRDEEVDDANEESDGVAEIHVTDAGEDGLIAENVMDKMDVTVNYRMFRHRCVHQYAHKNDVESLSDILQYNFKVPKTTGSDFIVDYIAPPFCYPEKPFEATITIRCTRDVSPFDYDLEASDKWTVEGPVTGSNQTLKSFESMQLCFKMTATNVASGGILMMPKIRFGDHCSPVFHKEIFLLSSMNTLL
ncbi:uncharacterized protein BXIN_0925 [Babesia sp. Xinjiang]|uniref:uncharacterized protein n=1 Tax=Babesia sp. Xinjiang TaxID=462227 RepID=UPI000A22B997|nr:uncharacterized protein BXIN_0925 [Babesia sp. Xinjiang]ORM42074.1 hypothetical protein BXIN_0925 [Babesia sp. Xinjiang]